MFHTLLNITAAQHANDTKSQYIISLTQLD